MSPKIFTLASSLLLLSTVPAFCVVEDILANAGAYKPKITVSDSYTEKVLVDNSDGYIFRSVEAAPQRIAITIVANLDGAEVGVIDADTSVGFSAGYFSHADSLGEAPDYRPTSKKVSFPLTKDVDLPNGDTAIVRVGTITYAWTVKTLTITVACTDVINAGVNDIAASDYLALAEAGTSVSIVNDPIDIMVNFGDASGARRAFLKGTSRTVTRKFGSVAADTYEELDLCDVTLQGAADVAGPVVKATFPAKPTLENQLSVGGTAVDIQAVTLDSVTINGVADTTATLAIADDDENGSWDWSVAGLQLKKGANALVLNFSDEDGNVTQLKKSYTVK